MQNVDFYEGRHFKDYQQNFDRIDPEFFSRSAISAQANYNYSQKKATGLFTIITALVIISFTAGLIIGIKFAGGSEKKIVDDHTMNAMTNISSKVTEMIKDSASSKPASEIYPKNEYPFVVQLSKDYTDSTVKPVAQFLSTKGHTVIISNNNGLYKIFIGPYKTEAEAKKILSEISLYKEPGISTNAQIIKRM